MAFIQLQDHKWYEIKILKCYKTKNHLRYDVQSISNIKINSSNGTPFSYDAGHIFKGCYLDCISNTDKPPIFIDRTYIDMVVCSGDIPITDLK